MSLRCTDQAVWAPENALGSFSVPVSCAIWPQTGRGSAAHLGNVGLKTALDLAQRLRPDLALVDVHLVDGETGPEIAEHLKEMGIPVLFMTANASTLPDGLADALGVIPKPVAAHVLKGAVRWVTDRDLDPPDLFILNR